MLIAIVGKQGTGKTTVAENLAKQGFKRLSFSTPIKETFENIFGHKNYDRGWMQMFGEGCRKVDDLVWIEHLNRSIEERLPANIVIDDGRYTNEVMNSYVPYIKRLGGAVIRLDAPELTRFMRRYQNAGIDKSSALAIEKTYGVERPPSFLGSQLLFAAGSAGLGDSEMEKVFNWTEFQTHPSETSFDDFDFTKLDVNYLSVNDTNLVSIEFVMEKVMAEVDAIKADQAHAAKLIQY